MRKALFSFIASSMTAMAAPQAVVFDWGNVLAIDDRSVVVNFMCQAFQLSEPEFESVNLEKRKAIKGGRSDVDFWLEFAKQKGISLPGDWPDSYTATLKASVGADPDMFALVDELKKQQVRVGLLSNINDRYTKLIRDFGFYAPFEPCLLSCEIGLEKPNASAYEALLQAIGLTAAEIVFIDDKMENIEAAKKMGIDAILFESPQQVRKELTHRNLLN